MYSQRSFTAALGFKKLEEAVGQLWATSPFPSWVSWPIFMKTQRRQHHHPAQQGLCHTDRPFSVSGLAGCLVHHAPVAGELRLPSPRQWMDISCHARRPAAHPHSVLKLVAGFASAARMACELTVTRVINTVSRPVSANIHQLIAI